MSIEKPANERLNLYNRFKDSLRSGDESTFFDADDLLIIIDQAVDLQDEYTEIEAIMRGYRFFPDNEELAARRAFLYYDLSLDEGVDNVRSRLTPDSTMSRILTIRRMQDRPENREKIIAILNDIADDPTILDDEEVIQLVDCAGAALCLDWLKANEKKLRKKTDYLPTLLYETFIIADMQGDRDYSIALLEELTELQPFNIDFWNALAQVHADSDDAGDDDLHAALNALDFALAIDSNNPEALTLKASILIKQGNAADAEKILRPVIDSNLSAAAAQVYTCALLEQKRNSEAYDMLFRFCDTFPDNPELFSIAIAISHPAVQNMFEKSFSDSSDIEATSRDWNSRAETFYRDGRLQEAITMFDLLHRRDALSDNGYKMYFSAFYVSGQYHRCIRLYRDMSQSRPDFLLPDMALAMIMSYLRLGNKSEARKALKEVSDRFPMTLRSSWTMATSAESIGMNNFMAAIKAMVNGHEDMQPDILDIFEYPYNQSPD